MSDKILNFTINNDCELHFYFIFRCFSKNGYNITKNLHNVTIPKINHLLSASFPFCECLARSIYTSTFAKVIFFRSLLYINIFALPFPLHSSAIRPGKVRSVARPLRASVTSGRRRARIASRTCDTHAIASYRDRFAS